MTPETYPHGGDIYERVSKTKARQAYEKGQSIWLVPSHVAFNFTQQWVRPCEISTANDTQDSTDFDRTINNYEYYNCCSELGTYTRFFVKRTKQQEGQSNEIQSDN